MQLSCTQPQPGLKPEPGLAGRGGTAVAPSGDDSGGHPARIGCEVIAAVATALLSGGPGHVVDAESPYGWRPDEARRVLLWDRLSPCGYGPIDIMEDAASKCIDGEWYIGPEGPHGVPEALVVDEDLWYQGVAAGREVGVVECDFQSDRIVVLSGAAMYGGGPLPTNPVGWESLLTRYPGLAYILSMTRPAISEDGTQAVVHVGRHSPTEGSLVGWYKLVRCDDEWRVQAFSATFRLGW